MTFVGAGRLSEDYPFFIQQYAKYAWLAADESPIDSDGHGRVDYTVPQFAAFMRRQFPAPAPRRKRR